MKFVFNIRKVNPFIVLTVNNYSYGHLKICRVQTVLIGFIATHASFVM